MSDVVNSAIEIAVVIATLYLVATGQSVPEFLLVAFGYAVRIPLDSIGKNASKGRSGKAD